MSMLLFCFFLRLFFKHFFYSQHSADIIVMQLDDSNQNNC